MKGLVACVYGASVSPLIRNHIVLIGGARNKDRHKSETYDIRRDKWKTTAHLCGRSQLQALNWDGKRLLVGWLRSDSLVEVVTL